MAEITYNDYYPYPLDTRHLADGRTLVMLSRFVYNDPEEGPIVCETGEVTDLTSTPRLIWWLLPPHGTYKFPAVAHDKLYKERPYGISFSGWRRADRVMFRGMRYAPNKVNPLIRAAIYLGLLVGGWWNYFRVGEIFRDWWVCE
jgi:hypothetical protein